MLQTGVEPAMLRFYTVLAALAAMVVILMLFLVLLARNDSQCEECGGKSGRHTINCQLNSMKWRIRDRWNLLDLIFEFFYKK